MVWVGMWIGRLSAKGEVCEELRNTMVFRVWGMWNIGRLSAMGEVCEELRNTMIGV